MVVSPWCLDTGDNTEEGGEAGLGRKAVCSDYILFCHSSNWPGLGARGVGGGRGWWLFLEKVLKLKCWLNWALLSGL